ncbi:uncharacterized protein LOC123561873 [Mercenaria mercenaria]|uniref:uncharacterized protein LOC123561873 n=1 Tax=Mercenaria mercenaria TaxID=6596 RepID=UPI00234EF1A0|nr:uncharacterized protein LOC123561873 [Mercenaria mercenaria]
METASKDGDTVHFKCSESVITCQICMDIFESPRILPCQHTFCKKCVVSLLNKHCLDNEGNTKKTAFPCPNCRRECKIRGRKGKHSIEEHLKCFPESLLLKTFLDSIDENSSCEKDKQWCKLDKENDLPELVSNANDGYSDRMYISWRAARVIEERLWFYYLFISTLSRFLFQAQVYFFGSLNTLSRSELLKLIQELLKIPTIINNPDLHQYHVKKYFDSSDIDTTLKNIRKQERSMNTAIGRLRQTVNVDTRRTFRDAQTQTESRFSKFLRRYRHIKYKLQGFISFILIKNTSFVLCLYEYLIPLPFNFKVIDFGLSFTIPYRKIRYWLLLLKLFDILTLIYFSGHSFYWSITLLIICYVLLLIFFKRIKCYVDGGIYIGKMLPLFATFLISLNLLTNLTRCYVYCFAIRRLEIWMLIKLAFFKIMPEVTVVVSLLVLIHYRKQHLFYQYGPFINLHL